MYGKYIDSEALQGRTIARISSIKAGDCDIDITTSDGKRWRFLHNQDCCESVAIHDIVGDLQGLAGRLVTLCKKTESNAWPEGVQKPEYCDSFTWTTLRIEAGDIGVTVRWLGESNGYYGEGIDLEEVE